MSESREDARTGEDARTIEGTYVFDGARSRKGYRLNKFFFSLNRAENRAAFREDADALMERFGLTDWEKDRIREKDWPALAREGGANIYVMYKMGSVTGDSLQHIGAAFRGQTLDEFLSTRTVQGAR